MTDIIDTLTRARDALAKIANLSADETDPNLTAEHSAGNDDDVFNDGLRQGAYDLAAVARLALAELDDDEIAAAGWRGIESANGSLRTWIVWNGERVGEAREDYNQVWYWVTGSLCRPQPTLCKPLPAPPAKTETPA